MSRLALHLLSLLVLTACAATPSFEGQKRTQADPDEKVILPPGEIFSFRQFQFESNSTAFRPVVKIMIVVDNSVSMADEQVYLSQGFQELMNALRDKELNLDFYVFTTTQLGELNQKPVAENIDYYLYENDAGMPVMTTDSTRFDQGLPVTRRSSKLLLPSITEDGAALQIRTGTSQSDFDEVSAQLQNVIASAGTNGNDNEQGLCTIARILEAEGERSLLEEGDFAAFLVISDSDDRIQDDDCLSYEETDFGTVTPNTQPQPELITTNNRNEAIEWRYSVRFRSETYNRLRIDYDYNTTCNVDGQTQACVRVQRTYPEPDDYRNPAFSTSFLSCDENMIHQLHLENPNRDFVPGTCRYYYYQQNRNFTYVDQQFILTDLCANPFGNHSNLEDFYRSTQSGLETYYLQSCSGSGRMLPNYAAISYPRKKSVREALSPGSQSLRQAIYDRSLQLFGEEGFFFSAIVDKPDSGVACSEPTEGFGVNYLEMAALLEDQGSSYPICSIDYYPALQDVESFINESVATSYQLSIESNEEIIGVTLIRDTARIELNEGSDYNVQGRRLSFGPNVLQPGDQIELEIQSTL